MDMHDVQDPTSVRKRSVDLPDEAMEKLGISRLGQLSLFTLKKMTLKKMTLQSSYMNRCVVCKILSSSPQTSKRQRSV